MAKNDFPPGAAAGHNHKHDSERSLQMTVMLTALFTGIAHLFLLIIFMLADIRPLVYLNVGSITVAGLCCLLIKYKKNALAGLLVSLEAIFYTFSALYLIGPESEMIFYFFLVLTMQLAIPYARMAARVVMSAVLWVCITAYILVGSAVTPVLTLPHTLNTLLTLFNIQVAFLGIIILLPIDFIIQKMLRHFWGNRMEELEDQAHTDHLTGLCNRRYADMLFERFREEPPNKQWCVAMLDIDDFKVVNDRYGHGAGDVVLQALSRVVTLSLRKTDVVIRWGGEEFLLLMENVELATAFDILEKLRRMIGETEILTESGILRITATIGVAVLRIDDIDGSIDLCDKKMYQGKADGKNRVVM